jgi:hypothetical protein
MHPRRVFLEQSFQEFSVCYHVSLYLLLKRFVYDHYQVAFNHVPIVVSPIDPPVDFNQLTITVFKIRLIRGVAIIETIKHLPPR